MKLATIHPYLRYAAFDPLWMKRARRSVAIWPHLASSIAASIPVTVASGFRTARRDAGLSVAVRRTATQGRSLDMDSYRQLA